MFLATGTGHCGTHWFASFMTKLGYPCGHEKLYNPWKAAGFTRSESSLFLVPFLHNAPEETPLVQLVRDPVRVLNSCMKMRTLSVGKEVAHQYPYSAFYYKHLPESHAYDTQVERLMYHITHWDRRVERYQPRMVMRVGDPGDRVADNWQGEKLAEMVYFCTGDEHDPVALRQAASKLGRVNDHFRQKTDKYTWETLPEGRLADEMYRRAVQYGFLGS